MAGSFLTLQMWDQSLTCWDRPERLSPTSRAPLREFPWEGWLGQLTPKLHALQLPCLHSNWPTPKLGKEGPPVPQKLDFQIPKPASVLQWVSPSMSSLCACPSFLGLIKASSLFENSTVLTCCSRDFPPAFSFFNCQRKWTSSRQRQAYVSLSLISSKLSLI